jgi:hypothetical protein
MKRPTPTPTKRQPLSRTDALPVAAPENTIKPPINSRMAEHANIPYATIFIIPDIDDDTKPA